MSASVQHGPGALGGGRLGFLIGLLALVLVAIAVSPALSRVSAMWSQAEYSHAWLIFPIAGLIFLYRYSAVTQGGDRWFGVAIAVFGAILIAAGWATRNTTFSIYGAIAGLYGVTWTSVGVRGMRSMTAPIAFLIFVVPLPLTVYISLSQTMQLISSKIGVALMAGLGVVVVRDGNIIELGNGRLEVAEACSGLRYLFPLLSVSFLLAILLDDRFWKKSVLFLSAFPIALIMNAIRLTLIGVLVDHYGMGMAEGLQHEVEGFVVFALCIGLLVLEVYILAAPGMGGRALAIDRLTPDGRTLRALTRWRSPKPFLVANFALAAGALLVCTLPARIEIIPERRPLALFPLSLPNWQGVPGVIDPQTLNSLQLTDYVMADFTRTDDADAAVNFYVAYYASQRIGVQVHSPRLCIPGGGWTIVAQSIVTVPAADGSPIPINRVLIEKGGIRQLVYYWFDERGRRSTGETENKLFALVDSVLLNRSDGALVRLVAPVSGSDETIADRNLRDVAASVSVRLRPFVPD